MSGRVPRAVGALRYCARPWHSVAAGARPLNENVRHPMNATRGWHPGSVKPSSFALFCCLLVPGAAAYGAQPDSGSGLQFSVSCQTHGNLLSELRAHIRNGGEASADIVIGDIVGAERSH